jgi:hypothetical protein
MARWLSPRFVVPVLIVSGALVSLWLAGQRLPASDEGALLTQAARILRGEIYYRDIDAYPFPLAPYLLAAAMGAFGEHLSVARSLGAATFIGILLALYSIALPLLGRARAALVGLLFLGFKLAAWPALSAFFYWDLAFLFACLAISLLVRHPFRGASAALFGAGALTGLAVMAKQSLGIYLGIASLLVLAGAGPLLGVVRRRSSEAWSEAGAYAAGMAAPLLLALAYFASHGLLGNMLYSGLVRPFVGYLPTSAISFWTPLRWWELGSWTGPPALPYFAEPYWQLLMHEALPLPSLYPAWWLAGELFSRLLYTSIPVAFAAALLLWLRATRHRERSADRSFFVFAALAAAVLLSAFPRADFAHVISVYPLVMILLAQLPGRFCGSPPAEMGAQPFPRWAAATVLGWLLLCSLGIALQASRLTYHMRLDRADLHIATEDAWHQSVIEYLRRSTTPDEEILVYGHEAHYYFLAGRYSSWPFVQLYPGQAGGDGGRALAARVRGAPPAIIVRGMQRLKGVPYLPRYTPALESEIRRSYAPDEGVFERFPPPAGDAPGRFYIELLRPREPQG